jgi:hypothetical protein
MTPVRPDCSNDFAVEEILPRTPARDESTHFTEGECYVWYRPSAELTFDAFVARVQKELGGRGHKTERSLALCIVGLFALCPRLGDTAASLSPGCRIHDISAFPMSTAISI